MQPRPTGRRRWSKKSWNGTRPDSQWCLFSWKTFFTLILLKLSIHCPDMMTDFVNALDLQGYRATGVFLKALREMTGNEDGSYDLQEVYHHFPVSLQQGNLSDINWENCYTGNMNFFVQIPNNNYSQIKASLEKKNISADRNPRSIIQYLQVELNVTEVRKEDFLLSEFNNSRTNYLSNIYFIAANDYTSYEATELRHLDWECLSLVEFHPIWGGISMSLLFFPGVVGFIFATIQYFETRAKRKPYKAKSKWGNYLLSFLTLFCFPAALIVIQFLSVCNPSYEIMADGFLGLEAFVESGPQLVLQLVIMVYLKKANYWQLATVIYSILAVSKTAIMYDMLFVRVEHAPAMTVLQLIKRVLSVLPMYATSLIFKTGSLVLIISYFRYWALFPLGLYWFMLLAVALCLKFGVSRSVLLASTNITIMGLGPFQSKRTGDSRFCYMLITSIVSFIFLSSILGVLLYYDYYYPTTLDHWDTLYFHDHHTSLNFICGIIVYTGLVNVMLLITSRYGNIASDMDEDKLWTKFKETFLAGNNNEKFLRASCNGHAEKMDIYIKIMGNGLDMNYIPFVVDNVPRKTPLTGAIEGGHMEAVQVLLKEPLVDVNKENGEREKPLSVALRKKRHKVLIVLLEHPSIDVNYNYFFNNDWYTPLTFAVSMDDLDLVKLLIDSPKIDINKEDKDGQTPLRAALSLLFLTQENYIENGETTLNMNEHLYQSFVRRATTIRRKIGPVDNLEKSMKKKNRLTKQQTLVKQTAIFRHIISHPDININVKVSMDGIKHTALTSVIMSREVDITLIPLVLDAQGVNINHTEGVKYSPLTAAITTSDETTIKKLLSMEGICVNEIDGLLNTPLTLAIMEDENAIIELLMTFPFIDVNYTQGAKFSPLTAAIQANDMNTFQWLLSTEEIEVNQIDGQGQTPLICAVTNKNISMTKDLLSQHKIDVNCVDLSNRSALYRATQNKDEQILQLLVEAPGINTDTKCGQEKMTAEQNAVKWGYGNLASIIRKARDSDKMIPIDPGQANEMTPIDRRQSNEMKTTEKRENKEVTFLDRTQTNEMTTRDKGQTNYKIPEDKKENKEIAPINRRQTKEEITMNRRQTNEVTPMDRKQTIEMIPMDRRQTKELTIMDRRQTK